jgi:nuclear migration protein JNM1
MQHGEAAMAGNVKVVEGWVKELEAKIAKLS